MPNLNKRRWPILLVTAIIISSFSACGSNQVSNSVTPVGLSGVPAVRLNYRYEADVPAPTLPATSAEERNAGVLADFDTNRTQEALERTITSPDKKHVFAIYRNITDLSSEFRIDAYSPDGKLIKKVTPDTMAVHFPDTIVWSPDSNSIAFVAMLRTLTPLAAATPVPASRASSR